MDRASEEIARSVREALRDERYHRLENLAALRAVGLSRAVSEKRRLSARKFRRLAVDRRRRFLMNIFTSGAAAAAATAADRASTRQRC